MRVACVLITHLRAKVELRRHPQLQDRPVLIVAGPPAQARPVVLDRFPAAAATNTLRVAERCAFDLSTDLGYTLPAARQPRQRCHFYRDITRPDAD